MTSERRGLLRKGAVAGGIVVLVVVAGVLVSRLLGGNSKPMQQDKPPIITLKLPPPPPPPPPPKPPPPQPQKMLEQPKDFTQATPAPAKPVAKAPAKPNTAKPSAVPAPPGNPLTSDLGPGSNQYGLQAGNGGGDVVGGGGGGGGGGGSQFGFYASMVQSQVRAALGRDEKTRSARYRAQVRVWLDGAGHITRVVVVSSSGDTAIDGTVLSRVLGGIGIGQGPPTNMPLPIVLSIAES